MQVTIADLHYKMKEVLQALGHMEPITIVHHGKEKAVIIPSATHRKHIISADHPFFGSARSDSHDAAAEMEKLRGGRYVCRGVSRTALAGKTTG